MTFALAAAVASTQPSAGSPGDAAIQRFQLRELRQRSLSEPVGPEIDRQLRRVERDRGGDPSPADDARLRFQLRAIPSTPPVPTSRAGEAARELDREPPSAVLPTPSTVEPDPPPNGSATDPVTLASRLIARGQASIGRGEVDHARSDAASARSLLARIGEVPPGHAAYPRLATARNRLNLLQGQIAAAEPAPPPRPTDPSE